MTDFTDSGRTSVLAALRAELFGPAPLLDGDEPQGRPIPMDPPPRFEKSADAYGPFHELGTGHEILVRDRPAKRYGIGVIYPQQQALVDANEGDGGPVLDDPGAVEADARANAAAGEELRPHNHLEADGDDFDLTTTSQYRPSAMAISFLAELGPGDTVRVDGSGGRYEARKVTIEGYEREWFVRRPVTFQATFPTPEKPGSQRPSSAEPADPLRLDVQLLARRHGAQWLCTVAVVNNASGDRSADTAALYQAEFRVQILRSGEATAAILPYPDPRSDRLLERDAEARSLDLMYRNAPTFAVGHGCAAQWSEPWGRQQCSEVRAAALPAFEAPSITPDVTLPDGTSLAVPMGPLAGMDPGNDGFDAIDEVARAYKRWIEDLVGQAAPLSGHRRAAADDHVAKCRRAHQRINDGLEWLRSDPTARRAFVLANRAILNQQLHFRALQRETRLTRDGFVVEPGQAAKDWRSANKTWRAFQIGFLVASAKSAVDGVDEDRETVELIFFPTGGGKTEAYLGLSAFCLFYQRLTGRTTGVSVLMRYTLRLLTSQQFLRASALICAMELIRGEENLGDEQFTIGIWVGGSTTPNNRADAKRSLQAMNRGNGDNPFLVLRCPWCAAQMGVVEAEKGVPKAQPKVAGYIEVGGAVRFRCPDRGCPFHKRLPVYVVDEDVYDARPSIVIGTVDKFAMLAFRPEARALFGIDRDGSRHTDPPNLIIQDELHLIAGPLGSMVGLYESIIEDLCTDHLRGGVRPKIVGSTATIRNYAEQIRGLYGRERSALFPPHGLDASDAFFAAYARDPATGKLVQGRMYVGVHAPGLGSIQTAQVRTGSALLQAASDLPDAERDPWWTSLMFFNSLRELGTSVSLLQSDIPDYLYTMKLRRGAPTQRFVNQLMELTSRLRQDEIPEAIAKLERPASSGRAIDVCLASNIIEVGVDIPRLSLLTVLGQPKSTSQYIQITGRVGRNWQERPGLVVTIYSAARPRDRSHFEKFQSYHQRLYAEVEPVSVTPFSTPVLRRAVHAAALVHVRQTEPSGTPPWPMPGNAFDRAESILLERVAISDPEARADTKRELQRRRTEWRGWEPAVWEARTTNDDGPLMRRAGEWVPDELLDTTWSTPMSMRDVDAECRCTITNRYAVERGDPDAEGDNP